MNKTEKALTEYYYSCKMQKRQLENQLKVETEKLQAQINGLNELMFDIESMLEKENIKPIYEHFEKFEEVEDGNVD